MLEGQTYDDVAFVYILHIAHARMDLLRPACQMSARAARVGRVARAIVRASECPRRRRLCHGRVCTLHSKKRGNTSVVLTCAARFGLRTARDGGNW